MKKTLVFILCLLSLFFFSTTIKHEEEIIVEAKTQDANGNWYWGYVSQLDESYYASLKGITNKTQFETALHNAIDDNKELGYSSSTRLSTLRELDEDPNNSNNVLCLYTGISFSKTANGSSGTTTWNTEHTWAKSHGFSSEGLRPYSDYIHLRVTQCSINSSRSNSGFKELSSGSKDSYGNMWSGNWFEPRDCVKGDVARIMMYMDIRYNGDSDSDGITLTLVNGETSGSSTTGKFGDLATLIKWHVEDPVDDLERQRNDKVQKLQGNRNPFVDHPEYANILYGANYPTEDEPTPEPTPEPTYKVTFNVDSNAKFNYTDNNEYKAGDKIVTPVNPELTGYTFDGWYKDSNYKNKWNFNTDTISSNITLYAKFTEIVVEPEVTFMEYFSGMSIKSQLTFKVKLEDEYKLQDNTLNLKYVLQFTSSEYNKYKDEINKIKVKINGNDVSYQIISLDSEYRLVVEMNVIDYNTVYVPVFIYDGYELSFNGYSAKTLSSYYLTNLTTDSLVVRYKNILESISK